MQEPKNSIEKHLTTVLVSVITAIVIGIGVTTIQNTQTSARIETKIDFMTISLNDYKISQKELYDQLNSRVQTLEEQIFNHRKK